MPQIDYDELVTALEDVKSAASLTMEEFQEAIKSLQDWFASRGIILLIDL